MDGKRKRVVVRKHRRKRLGREDLKLYLAITLVCFFIAVALYYMLDKGGLLFEEPEGMSKGTLEAYILEKIEKSQDDVEDIPEAFERRVKNHKGGIDTGILEKAKKDYAGRISEAELEKLRETYEERREKK
jgi:hypothetical protein